MPMTQGLKKAVLRGLDGAMAPGTALSALLLKGIRRIGLERMPLSRRILQRVGVLPVRNHYYEPWVAPAPLAAELSRERSLPGLELNLAGQWALLERFDYAEELRAFPLEKTPNTEYFYHNRFFGPGDSEFLYSVIRLFKPRRIIEIGSGYSTLMARNALRRNAQEPGAKPCEHFCIEPYEQPWLERCGATILRQRVETVPRSLFESLEGNDLLFIDSSHIIRPGGDVLLEYLELLPTLRPGVLVHVHDIFTPRHYPAHWLIERGYLWNEQYLLEALLSNNQTFSVIGALNHLAHQHPQRLAEKFPVFAAEPWHELGSFWLVREAAPARLWAGAPQADAGQKDHEPLPTDKKSNPERPRDHVSVTG